MRILITGNMGYIGPVLGRYLKNNFPDISLVGYDAGFFGHSLTGAATLPELIYERQFFGDIRDITSSHLEGIDSIVHLAAISNDPMGNEFEDITNQINRRSSIRLAKIASEIGVKSFVFASSCSMYGQAEGGPRRESDPTNPLTAYAKSKIGTENDIQGLDLGGMVVTSLRFATACGMSDRLRLDLVLNDFVACAITANKITVLSDGSPWRPLIDVEDMSRVISWAVMRDAAHGGQFLAVNAGRDEGNFQVVELAEAVASLIPKTTISINKDAPPDKRSYSVDFSLYKRLAPNHQPKVTLEQSIECLHEGLLSMKFNDKNFRESSYMRLNTLRKHMSEGRLSSELRWNQL